MDVHAPHEPVHSWRDFFVHLSIMTVGLFIALMLEALVEHVHHRHVVREARENIRRELQDNHDAAQKDLGYFAANLDRVKKNIATLQSMRTKPQSHMALTNTMSFDSFSQSAWRTARDTGALTYMPYDEVQRYSDIYETVDMVNRRAETIAETEFTALAPAMMGYDMDAIPPGEIVNMLRGNAQTQIDLMTEQQFVQQLDADMLAALKK
jgi:hypothetical protein